MQKRRVAAIMPACHSFSDGKFNDICLRVIILLINTLKTARYLMLNNVDMAMECLENDYELHEMSLAYSI